MKIWYEDEGDRTTGIDMGCIDLLRIMHMSRLTPHKTGDTPGMADELFGKERNLYERHNRRRKDSFRDGLVYQFPYEKIRLSGIREYQLFTGISPFRST